MSDLERLKAYHQIQPFVNDDTKKMLIEELGLQNSNLEKRLPGLKAEDEFALILYFLQCCKHIISIDEITSVLTDESNQADYLLHLKNDEKFLVEIKSSPTSKYKIGKNNLHKRMQFAKDMGFDLYFALRLNGIWTMYSATYLEKSEGKIDIKNDYNESIFSKMFGSQLYIIPEGIEIESKYSKCHSSKIMIYDQQYGNLISYHFRYDNKEIFSITQEDDNWVGLHVVLTRLHELMAAKSAKKITSEDYTILVWKTENWEITFDYQYYLTTIHHIVDERFNYHDSSSFLKYLVSGENMEFSKEILDMVMLLLKDKFKVPIKCTMDDVNLKFSEEF